MTKYDETKLPSTPDAALAMAADREEWARDARSRDLYGTAAEYELSALLLRFYAQHCPRG